MLKDFQIKKKRLCHAKTLSYNLIDNHTLNKKRNEHFRKPSVNMKLNININLRYSQDLDQKVLKTIKASNKYESQDTEVKHSINK